MDSRSHKIYANDFLNEVYCYIKFDTAAEWPTSAFNNFQEAVRQLGYDRIEVTSYLIEAGSAALVRYYHHDGQFLLQLSPNGFSANWRNGSYPGWDTFWARVQEAAQCLYQVIPATIVCGVALRYVNRFPLSNSIESVKELFVLQPSVPALDGQPGAFVMRCQWEYEADKVLTVSLGAALPTEEDASGVLLELDYSLPVREGWTWDQFENSVETAHQCIYNAFNGIATDALKQIMDKGEK